MSLRVMRWVCDGVILVIALYLGGDAWLQYGRLTGVAMFAVVLAIWCLARVGIWAIERLVAWRSKR